VASSQSGLQRVAERSTLRVDAGAVAEQQLDNVPVASRPCGLQRVAVESTLRVDVSTVAEQQLNDVIGIILP
jgi:hypothetical protein